MSQRALLIVIVIAIALGAVLIFVGRSSQPRVNPDEPLVTFDPADVRAITIATHGGGEHTVARTERGGWAYLAKPADTPWPCELKDPRQLLAVLADLRPVPGATPPDGDIREPVTITLTTDADPIRFRIASVAVAGNVVAQADDGPRAVVTDAVLTAATRPGPRGWRLRSALPGVNTYDTDRITIATPDRTIVFAKRSGRWVLTQPVAARVNPATIDDLIRLINAITIARFDDGPIDRAAVGLARPALTITAERDLRTTGGTTVDTRTLAIGAPADPASLERFAAPDPRGSLLLVIAGAADPVAAIPIAPRHYLALTASGTLPADVGMIHTRVGTVEAAYRRNLGAWESIDPDMPAPDQQDVDDLLGFLAGNPGEPELALSADALRTVATIQLFDFETDLIETISLGWTADGVLGALTGPILILYPGMPPPAILDMPTPDQLPTSNTPTNLEPIDSK